MSPKIVKLMVHQEAHRTASMGVKTGSTSKPTTPAYPAQGLQTSSPSLSTTTRWPRRTCVEMGTECPC